MKTINQMSAAAEYDNPMPPTQEQASGSLQPAGSTSPDQERLDFLATIVRLELTDDERAYTTTAHVRGVLKVLKKMGIVR